MKEWRPDYGALIFAWGLFLFLVWIINTFVVK